MPNMDPKKCPMPSQDPNVRNKNFKEVALGYTAEMAVNEAKRCLPGHRKVQRAARCLWPCLPAGEPVRGQVRAWHQGRTRRHWPPGALCG